MSIEGYVDYKRREYCKDIKCTVQLDLDATEQGSKSYEKIRKICQLNLSLTIIPTIPIY